MVRSYVDDCGQFLDIANRENVRILAGKTLIWFHSYRIIFATYFIDVRSLYGHLYLIKPWALSTIFQRVRHEKWIEFYLSKLIYI